MRGLQQLADRASPELTVIVGAGLDAERIRLLVGNTNIREFHVGRAARFDNDVHQPVDSARVKHLVSLLPR
ncbi:MAG TPA: hypothetical protein VLX58_01880, partial [Bryobacteraceae bacterium]|nr:hypothetical protein [Bryobacteraceae bacterium]